MWQWLLIGVLVLWALQVRIPLLLLVFVVHYRGGIIYVNHIFLF